MTAKVTATYNFLNSRGKQHQKKIPISLNLTMIIFQLCVCLFLCIGNTNRKHLRPVLIIIITLIHML